MRYKELVCWGKKYGYTVEKESANIISWYKNDNPDNCGSSDSKNKIAQDIYNDITNGVWVEYQREEAARKATEEIHIDPM
jgi:hypothetical protein